METAAPVTFRSIRASDLALLRGFVRKLSRDTAYKRLLSGRTPSEEELARWTAIDPAREAAVVATTGRGPDERLVGVARYVMESPDDTDFAIVLADAWQRRGLGRALLERLVAMARVHGVRRLSGLTLSTNIPMLSLGRALGFRARRQADAFTTMLTLDLPGETMPAAYHPVSCEFHDVLEALATTRRRTQIRFNGSDGLPQQRDAVIQDVFSREGAEYIVISSGETLRLDQLVAVDGAQAAQAAR